MYVCMYVLVLYSLDVRVCERANMNEIFLSGANAVLEVHRYHPIIADDDNNSSDVVLAVVDVSPAPGTLFERKG